MSSASLLPIEWPLAPLRKSCIVIRVFTASKRKRGAFTLPKLDVS